MKRKAKKPNPKAASSQESENSVLKKLEVAAKDLLYISETDAPLEPFFWPGERESLTPEFIKQQATLPADVPVS